MNGDRWLTFDCYGTLFDWQAGFRTILSPLVATQTQPLIDAYHQAEARVERELPSAPYRTILAESLSRAGIAARTALMPSQLGVLAERWDVLPPFPETERCLLELRGAGWKLGVLTNCDTDLFARTQAGFPVQFDEVVTAEQVGNYKPDLAHFSEFERRTGVHRDNWVHAAVSWWHDMEPARLLGLRRIWVDRENTGHDASTVTARVENLDELVDVLR